MKVSLRYGKGAVPIDVPDDQLLGVFEPRAARPAHDPSAELERATSEPIGSEPFENLVGPDSRVAIVVDDATRTTPSRLILEPLWRRASGSVSFALGAAHGGETAQVRGGRGASHEPDQLGVLAGPAVEIGEAGRDPGQVHTALRLAANREVLPGGVQHLELTRLAGSNHLLDTTQHLGLEHRREARRRLTQLGPMAGVVLRDQLFRATRILPHRKAQRARLEADLGS